MPGKKTQKPLRGEAAWQAARQEMARRNDAARDQHMAQGAEHKARVAEARLAAERQADAAPGRVPQA